MTTETSRTIAVVGSTGAQGGGVVRALQAQGEFRVRALTRNPDRAEGLADEVVAADLTNPETLDAALEGAYGVFANTNSFAGPDVDEVAQGTAAVEAAKAAGVEHYVWSTLPNVDEISGGSLKVPHFTNKATVNGIVEKAGFDWFTFVEPPFYYQNFLTPMYPRDPGPDGTPTWRQPMRADARGIHVGDITELGNVVAGAFANRDQLGHGEILSLAGDLVSWDDLVGTLNGQGHHLAYEQVTDDPFGIRDMFAYFEQYTYMGPNAEAKIAPPPQYRPSRSPTSPPGPRPTCPSRPSHPYAHWNNTSGDPTHPNHVDFGYRRSPTSSGERTDRSHRKPIRTA